MLVGRLLYIHVRVQVTWTSLCAHGRRMLRTPRTVVTITETLTHVRYARYSCGNSDAGTISASLYLKRKVTHVVTNTHVSDI